MWGGREWQWGQALLPTRTTVCQSSSRRLRAGAFAQMPSFILRSPLPVLDVSCCSCCVDRTARAVTCCAVRASETGKRNKKRPRGWPREFTVASAMPTTAKDVVSTSVR